VAGGVLAAAGDGLVEALDVDQVHALGLDDGVVDVTRHGQVDEHEVAGALRRDVGGGDGEVVGARRGDREVDVGQGGGTVVEVDDVGRDARLTGVLGEAFRAAAGAVGDDELLHTEPSQVRRRQGG